MKKICFILLLFAIFIFPSNCKYVSYSYENKLQYAKVLSGCVLYKSIEMKDNYDDIYFYIPESYFVVVLEELNQNCIKVQYDKYIGYIKKSCIVVSNFIPIVKTLEDIKVDIKETSGTQLWSKPTTSGAVLTTIPAGFKRIEYIAKIKGDIPYGGVSNIWYYVSYIPFDNSTNVYEGYIYSENTTNLDEIVFNAESNPEIYEIKNEENNITINLNSTLKTIIVALISIPIILFFVVILYKLIIKFRNNTNKVRFQNVENAENYYDEDKSLKDDNLKSKINDMRYKVFTKQSKYEPSKDKYPKFPIYDSEDDLL